MAQTILYYPTINIQDGSWLRSALLYWDKISSIMPYSNYSGLSPELKYLEECGIYKPLFPQELFRSEYEEDFVATVLSRLERHKEKVASRQKNINHSHKYSRFCDQSLHDQIHYNKFSSEILEYLYANSYISCCNNDWVEIDSQAASIYMQTLAEFVIKCYPEDIVLSSDQANYLNQIYHPTKPSKKSACLFLSLENCLPCPSMNASYEALLEFKIKHSLELLEMRKKIRAFEATLSKCESAEQIQFEYESFKESWQKVLLENRAMFSPQKNLLVMNSLKVCINVATTLEEPLKNLLSSIQCSNTIEPYVLAAISLTSAYISYHNKINKHTHETGFSYLLKASRSGIINQFEI